MHFPRLRALYTQILGRRSTGYARLAAVVLLFIVIVLRLADPLPLETLRLKTFDFYAQLFPRAQSAQPIAIVDLDEESLAQLGQWPWPRTVVSDLLLRLSEFGAVAVAFDIVFAEADRLSPGLYASSFPGIGIELKSALRELPSNDSVLADTMRKFPSVLGQSGYFRELVREETLPLRKIPIAFLGEDPSRFLIEFPDVVRNIAPLEAAAAGIGMFTLLPEQDGIVRRVPALMRYGDVLMPSLSVELLRVVMGGAPLVVRTDSAGINSLSIAKLRIPTDGNGRIWVHYAKHDPGIYISAKDVLEGSVPKKKLAGKLILIGTSATGLFDIKATPLDSAMPGVEVHAQLLQTMLTGDFLVRPNYALGAELFLTVVLSIIMIVLVPIIGAKVAFGLGAGLAVSTLLGSLYLYSQEGLLLSPSYPLLSSLVIYSVLVFHNYISEETERRYVRSAFGQYLSPDLVEQLAQDPQKLILGGQVREMTVFFSDVRGFTTISESYKADPAGLTRLMNRILTPITNDVLSHRGTIDKYIGDAVMAFWNAPLDDAVHAENACRAALSALESVEELNREREREAAVFSQEFLPLRIGIGINSGNCLVGNLGSDMRFDYSVMGDTVNVASRLEGLTKLYGVAVVIGDRTRALCATDLAFMEIDFIKVKGKTEPERIYALLGAESLAKEQSFNDLAKATEDFLAAFRDCKWDEAEALLAHARTLSGPHKLESFFDLYATRIVELRQSPPPPDWDGSIVSLEK